MSAGRLGRLADPPNATLFRLLYEPQVAGDGPRVLPYLLWIDAAHVVMLARQRLLRAEVAAPLLALNRELVERLAAGENILGAPPSHRGLYFLYENTYVARLGRQRGGAAHLARSRNDINATVARMRLRDELVTIMDDSCALFAAMIALASRHADTHMSGFTHLQPAQPSTFGHYLAGLLAEMMRTRQWLDGSFDDVNSCPMGAAAGFGTAFPIDRAEMARLLGFARVVENSADAVASRDYVVRVLSALALLGSSLTRLATDLQTWSSRAYEFVGWPDELVSTSSIMPQKRNAYVLENVRGEAIRPVGALVNALLGLKNVPFTNSVEVSSGAVAHLWPAVDATRLALRLMRLLVENVEVSRERMWAFLSREDTTMTALADLLVRHGLAFRVAHDAVGRLVGEGGAPSAAAWRERLEAVLREETGEAAALESEEVERALDARWSVSAACYGGGPAPDLVRAHLESLGRVNGALQARAQAWRARRADAEEDLRRAAGAIDETVSRGEALCRG